MTQEVRGGNNVRPTEKEERDKGLIAGGSVNSGDGDMQGFGVVKIRRKTGAGAGGARLVPKSGWTPYPKEDRPDR